MKTLDKIPTKKLERTSKLVKTGVKIGSNYLKYYLRKLTENEDIAKSQLNENNAEDIYDTLKELKGSALKVAQMLSMENGILPEAFVERFSLAQFSVPPLSGALVRKTFRKYFGKNSEEIFDDFSPEAVNAATIGQVHRATKDGKQLAVKIQYPGVRDSIASDLKIVKPVALKMFNIPKKGSEKYFKEVEDKLLEECDYRLELKNSLQFAAACHHLPNLKFPNYYPELSADRILTMDWMEGVHFSEFVAQNPDQECRNKIGQAFWDFYMYQIHVLKKLHADPHPGNFLISKDIELQVIDFGCIKVIPEEFYHPYFVELTNPECFNDPVLFEKQLDALEVLKPGDTPEQKAMILEIFGQMVQLFLKPLESESFDFSNDDYFNQIANLGKRYADLKEIRYLDANRGSKHFIYVNRTFFGLYNMMHSLRAQNVKVKNYLNFILK